MNQTLGSAIGPPFKAGIGSGGSSACVVSENTEGPSAFPGVPARSSRKCASKPRALARDDGRGADVPLEAIARHAGVGIGTLYRHFLTRDALVEAAYRNEVARLEDAAAELLADQPPDAALAEWLDRYVAYATAKRGLGSALRSIAAAKADLYPQTRQRLQAAVFVLLAADQSSGALRTDVDVEDVFSAVSGVWTIPEGPDFAERARRLLRLLMDGLQGV